MKLISQLVVGLFVIGLNASALAASARTSDDLTLKSWNHSAPLVLPANLVPGNFPQNIDHFGMSDGTFAQRYWIDSSYAANKPDAPVIFHICGEGDATQGYFLHDNAIEWAKTLGAHLVYLEHRYYGKSLPFADLSNEHMAFLTLDNVLEDLATFQKWVMVNQGWKGKWITVGGSYSATVSAIYRQTHPELVVGALAASGPMISGTTQDDGSQADVNDLSSTDPSDDTGDRQWVYQACTKFGFWQTDEITIFNPSAWLCQQLFGKVVRYDSTTYNQKYYTPFLTSSANAPSNILFTYGSEDIWTTIGLPAQSNQNTKITIHVIPGAGHHYDLNDPTAGDSNDVKAARALFVTLAKKWLN
jgi:pimeloyl-ACP methyl ester carboxylesterase